jgi:hypothetical protein
MYTKTPQKVEWYLSMLRKHTSEVEVKLQSFLTWALHGVECSTSRLVRFKPGERNSGTSFIRVLDGLEGGLNHLENRKRITPLPGIEAQFLCRPTSSLV